MDGKNGSVYLLVPWRRDNLLFCFEQFNYPPFRLMFLMRRTRANLLLRIPYARSIKVFIVTIALI